MGEGAGDLRFSNTTGILQKKKTVWFIGVEVEQETIAPPPKKIVDPSLFYLVFVFCSLLPSHLNILNIFYESTSLLISYIYLLFSFTTMLDVSNQNRISKAGPILTLAWHIHNLTGKFIIGPNIDN